MFPKSKLRSYQFLIDREKKKKKFSATNMYLWSCIQNYDKRYKDTK